MTNKVTEVIGGFLAQEASPGGPRADAKDAAVKALGGLFEAVQEKLGPRELSVDIALAAIRQLTEVLVQLEAKLRREFINVQPAWLPGDMPD